MSDGDFAGFAPPPFKPDDALTQLKRQLRERIKPQRFQLQLRANQSHRDMFRDVIPKSGLGPAQRLEQDAPPAKGPEPIPPVPPRSLTEADAIDIWIARWLRVRQKDLLVRYGCDSRRLYEIWWGDRFPVSKRKAADLFRHRYPSLAERTDFGYRRIPRGPTHASQPDLFE